MAHEQGIAPAPRIALIDDPNSWSIWARWFERLVVAIFKIQTFSVTVDVASVGANSESVQTFTVTGITTADIITVNKPTNEAGLDLVQSWCETDNTLSLKYRNNTGSAIDPASETYLVMAVRT